MEGSDRGQHCRQLLQDTPHQVLMLTYLHATGALNLAHTVFLLYETAYILYAKKGKLPFVLRHQNI